MSKKDKFTQDQFDEKIISLAEKDGAFNVVQIPGVWEHVSEHYNNKALEELEAELDATQPDDCLGCGKDLLDMEYNPDSKKWICPACGLENDPVEEDDAQS